VKTECEPKRSINGHSLLLNCAQIGYRSDVIDDLSNWV